MLAVEKVKDSILDPEKHERLIADIDRYARVAGIPVRMIHQSAKKILSSGERDWVVNLGKKYRHKAGLLMTGEGRDVMTSMSAMVGVFLRAYIDARMVAYFKTEEDFPDCQILMLPTFCIGDTKLPGWRKQDMTGLIMQRHQYEQQTVIYATDTDALRSQYGDVLADFILRNYVIN